ncbi:MAG: CoA-binding protein [Candidatus Obscuribacterales bacterium]|nr:CoA-binding protein [Candidatus Obscuribacterales bacterium]
MDPDSAINEFLAAPAFAVVGASDDPYKFGHKCYRCYLDNGMKAYPVNPNVTEVLGNPAYKDLLSLPEPVQSVSVITQPYITEKVVDDAIKAGVKNIWMQPGAESELAVSKATKAGLNVIYGGPCLLVVMSYRGK